ncbi:MAG TPA: glycosyl transferase family protein [Bryobacteraceae bacterium]|nr:glycosyl transferase family protein [Bryobacteraceae bacterium]
MDTVFTVLTQTLDPIVGALLLPLAVWLVVSGIEDVVIDLIGFYATYKRRDLIRRERTNVFSHPQRRFAVMVPCWQEHRVIAEMVQQNLHAIRYSNFEFFLGVYPNDAPTLHVAQGLAARFANVHCAVCPHDGPTSKADCLNWIYQRIVAAEAQHSQKFEALITHDAEDVIHPDAFHWTNYFLEDYEMVQIPVLPLHTPVGDLVHGIYCDEFTEYQSRDMPARDFMGAFIPSNGVGTGFRRDVVNKLADAEHNRIFEPVCLTEDYENGYRLRLQGAMECFVPTHFSGVATREYFPRSFRAAVRQRTRWTTGIALQTWARHGWKGRLVDRYWLWRDRKGLIGNPLSLLTNVLSAYSLLAMTAAFVLDRTWTLAPVLEQHSWALAGSAWLAGQRTVVRAVCVNAIYGWRFVLGLPVRVILANIINSLAVIQAMRQFLGAKLHGRPLVWVKTEHQYPSQLLLAQNRQSLEDVLIGCGYVEPQGVALALRDKLPGQSIGEFLMMRGLLSEENLYEALSLQHGLPQGEVSASSVEPNVARALPLRIARAHRAVPFKAEFGSLLLAVPEVPTLELRETLQKFTSLEVRFHLVTPSNWGSLSDRLLESRPEEHTCEALESAISP